ncbi:hypothetical protein BDW22DRAFT_107257 [Trametopsis cervina]|nr:hypothetical protein BDW22DRAFT_107257 [Trametopsis cervina]
MPPPSDNGAPVYGSPTIQIDDSDSSNNLEGAQDGTPPSLANRTPFYASSSSSSTELNSQRANRPSSTNLLYPPTYNQSAVSLCSTASNTPVPSRSASPLYVHDEEATSSCSSDGDDYEMESSSFLRDVHKRSFSLSEVPRWWTEGPIRRRRRLSWYRLFRKYILPFVPKTPLTIIFTLLCFIAFAISLANLIIYLCNPDKQPLPWRGYCTLPDYTTEPPAPFMGAYASFPIEPPQHIEPRKFPPENLDSLSPAGVFLGVFSMDSGFERRSLIRETYASHPRSRNGAGEGDGGMGTSRTVIRFIMGKPRKDLERKVQLEMEGACTFTALSDKTHGAVYLTFDCSRTAYNDIVILPIKENMNDGKTYAFFHWAAHGAWVPPLYYDHFEQVPQNLSYANATRPAPLLAHHDPIQARQDQLTGDPKPWVRPDFILKADDDSFVMLAELEAHLRVELHGKSLPRQYQQHPDLIAPAITPDQPVVHHPSNDDPLIFWGYLVKNRFMAGELYALSHSLVDWIASNPDVKENVRGAEDQVTARWVRWHPRAQDVRWVRERCWIYDHPKAGTVYSRGFLFPSQMHRIQRGVLAKLEAWRHALRNPQIIADFPNIMDGYVDPFGPHGGTPHEWVLSSVSTFRVRYTPPVQGFALNHSIESLVEGSELSSMKSRNVTLWDEAYRRREGRVKRYEGKRVGGTTVVHSIKKHLWFLETANALLEGDDYTETEMASLPRNANYTRLHQATPLGRRDLTPLQ